LLDLSHLNERRFWDVAELSKVPLVASHSNAHALCPSTRNLTDRQLDAIRDSDGMVGANFTVAFLREDDKTRRIRLSRAWYSTSTTW
jgi:membrane dipeptidase